MNTDELNSERRRARVERKIYAEECPICHAGPGQFCVVIRCGINARLGKEMAVAHRDRVFAAIRTQDRRLAARARQEALA